MIAYCLITFLNCKTPECLNEVKRIINSYESCIKKPPKEKKDGLLLYDCGMPANIISISNYPYKTKKLCDQAFKPSYGSPLTYGHVCYTVSVMENRDCFGYKMNSLSGGFGVVK